MVPPNSRKVPRVSRYSGSCRCLSFSCTRLSLSLAGLSRTVPLTNQLTYAVRNPRVHALWFGLFPFRSPLLWESRLISFPSGTEMFHFPELALDTLCIQVPATEHDLRRVSPFRNPRIIECLASPRGFSQLTTSFIAFRRQGIHPMLLSTCLLEKNFLPSLFNCKRAITFVMAGSYPVRTRNLLRFLSEVIRGAWRGGPGKT